jgi:hypothetical protein
VKHLGRYMYRQARLAAAPQSGQRDQARGLEELPHLAQLAAATDEAVDLLGQVVRHGIDRPQGTKARRKLGVVELEHVLGAREILQAIPAQEYQRHAVRQGVGGHAHGCR